MVNITPSYIPQLRAVLAAREANKLCIGTAFHLHTMERKTGFGQTAKSISNWPKVQLALDDANR